MPKRKPGEEVFLDGDREVCLVADFGFLVAVNSTTDRDVADLFTELANGLTTPTVVRDVIACAMQDQDGATVEAERLIERYGLQECAYMARTMLSHAMIGDVKKSAMARHERLGQMTGHLLPSLSTAFWKVGLLWVVSLATSTALACMIFRPYILPT